MLRLARLRPLAQAVPSFGSGWRHFPRVYASTQATQTSDILKDIAPSQAEQTGPRSEFQRFTAPLVEEQNQQQRRPTSNLESPFDALNYKDFSDERFGDDKYTTRSHNLFTDTFPALKHEVDTQNLHAKLKYEQVFLKDHAYEPKTVFKFKKVVTKNYRTITRSWPQVHLNSFKYGNEHFLDELYDDLEGKYAWNNQLAYPDGSINLFCGTDSKGSPINVKGDPLALTYDDGLHKFSNAVNVRLELTKEEADRRFPFRNEAKPPPPPEPPARTPRVPSDFETEAEEDARLAEDRAYVEQRAREQHEKRLLEMAAEKERFLPEKENETEAERRGRWKWETQEDDRRPWRTMQHRAVRKDWDGRVVYDPVTMVRLVSYSARGEMSERYYYRDEISPENTTLSSMRSDEELDPDYDEKHEVLGYPKEDNAWRLDSAAIPYVEHIEAYSSADAQTRERTRHAVATELLPLREEKEGGEKKEVEYKTKTLRKDLLDVGVLPNSIREDMVKSFEELLAEGNLKEEDKWTYYNDYVGWVAKAMSRQRAEEYRKNIINENPSVNLPGMYHVEPVYYFKYIKINPSEGWIRFYVGEHNRADKGLETMLATDVGVDLTSKANTMKYPFTWTYSEYKLSREDTEAIKKVRWPPSLVPPPTSVLQNGDGSPQDQLARYFEKTYLQFGHDVRFNPQDCFDPAYDKLEDPNLKYMRSVGSSLSDVELIPDVGPLDLSARTDLSPAQRDAEEKRLRGVIRRAAADAMDKESESLISAYANQVGDPSLDEDLREELDAKTAGHSLIWLYDRDYVDPDLIPSPAPLPNDVPNQQDNLRNQLVKRLRNRFQVRNDTVYVYDADGRNIIQEYQGYRFRITKDETRIRIVRQPNAQNAKVVYYGENGQIERTEFHPYPNIDFAVSSARGRFGRSGWAFASDAHAEVAMAHGLGSKRAAEIKKAEQDQADALTEALSLLDDGTPSEREGGEEEDVAGTR